MPASRGVMTNGGLLTTRSNRSPATGSSIEPSRVSTTPSEGLRLSAALNRVKARARSSTSVATTTRVCRAACSAWIPHPVPRSSTRSTGRRIVSWARVRDAPPIPSTCPAGRTAPPRATSDGSEAIHQSNAPRSSSALYGEKLDHGGDGAGTGAGGAGMGGAGARAVTGVRDRSCDEPQLHQPSHPYPWEGSLDPGGGQILAELEQPHEGRTQIGLVLLERATRRHGLLPVECSRSDGAEQVTDGLHGERSEILEQRRPQSAERLGVRDRRGYVGRALHRISLGRGP